MGKNMLGISIIIIAKNEDKNIKNALASVKWADEIIVVDSGSRDKTLEIAREFTDKIYYRKFDDFSSQKNFALSKCSYNWIFSLDCDELVSETLQRDILSAVKVNTKYAAFRVKRINKLFGKVLYHAAGNDFPIRLFKKENSKFIQPIHEFLEVTGAIGVLNGELLHNTTSDIKSEFYKTDAYTELEARWLLERNLKPTIFKIIFYPTAVFLKIYIFYKGLLDGQAGFLYAFVSARYSLIKYIKARKLSKNCKYLENIIAKRFNNISEQFPDRIDKADARLNKLLSSLPKGKDKLILEIGCGKGRFTNAVIENNAVCVGADVSSNFLLEASRKNKGIFLMSSATDLAFKARAFDAVFAVEVIEHIAELKKCIQEVARVLKPEGVFVIIDRNIVSINNRRWFIPNVIIKKHHELKNDWMYPRGFPYTERWFLKAKIAKVLKSYFSKVCSQYILSDAELKSQTAFLFKCIPLSRHFILWKASGPK